MAGNRWRVEAQLRYSSVETGLPYYWTNVFYYENLSSDPYSGDYYNTIIYATHRGTLDTVDRVAIRVTNITTDHEFGIVTIPWVGAIDSLGEQGSLTNVIRLVGWNDGRQVSYKLWRMPLRLRDIEASRLTAATLGLVNDDICDVLGSVQFCNVHGVPIEEWTCDGVVHSWQLRHGTKRRERVVYAYS